MVTVTDAGIGTTTTAAAGQAPTRQLVSCLLLGRQLAVLLLNRLLQLCGRDQRERWGVDLTAASAARNTQACWANKTAAHINQAKAMLARIRTLQLVVALGEHGGQVHVLAVQLRAALRQAVRLTLRHTDNIAECISQPFLKRSTCGGSKGGMSATRFMPPNCMCVQAATRTCSFSWAACSSRSRAARLSSSACMSAAALRAAARMGTQW